MKLEFPISTETKDGRELIIRSPDVSDAERLADFVNGVWAEAEHLTMAPGERSISYEDERKYVEAAGASLVEIIFIAELGPDLIGMIGYQGGARGRTKHTVSFGMSVAAPVRELGNGARMLKTSLDWIRTKSSWEKVCLEVLADNDRAIHLYEKLGFAAEGRKVRHVRRAPGHDVDLIQMALWV